MQTGQRLAIFVLDYIIVVYKYSGSPSVRVLIMEALMNRSSCRGRFRNIFIDVSCGAWTLVLWILTTTYIAGEKTKTWTKHLRLWYSKFSAGGMHGCAIDMNGFVVLG